ncbi:hypothetical protein NITGR_530003 [Nitrospina gracilis 3/211]|uniref:Uncharacterized protein n=1 Tax=Nitrospina gracilis (strain 3/211) TaxID=1266370 RepID=M1ZCC8_NITG3|nr:hypothetical protein NITGR_530003 [Nitrospina gracilis 3/211]
MFCPEIRMDRPGAGTIGLGIRVAGATAGNANEIEEDAETARPPGSWTARSKPVSRVLFSVPEHGAMIINLGLPLPAGSSDQPESIGRAALKRFPI